MGQNVGQSDMERNMGRRGMGWKVGQSDLGQKDRGRSDMGQIKDEETKTSISKVEDLPSTLGAPPETPPPWGLHPHLAALRPKSGLRPSSH